MHIFRAFVARYLFGEGEKGFFLEPRTHIHTRMYTPTLSPPTPSFPPKSHRGLLRILCQ